MDAVAANRGRFGIFRRYDEAFPLPPKPERAAERPRAPPAARPPLPAPSRVPRLPLLVFILVALLVALALLAFVQTLFFTVIDLR